MIITAPISGDVVLLHDVPDPVFARGIVGPGAAIQPFPGGLTVVSPCAGTVKKATPHAFIITTDDGDDVLVHLGIDTFKLEGKGFLQIAQQGSRVTAEQPLTIWNTAIAEDEGHSICVLLVVMGARPERITVLAEGTIEAGKPVLQID